MTEELKPVRCGCGGEAKIETVTTRFEKVPRFRIRCEKCSISTIWDYFSESDVVKAWNKAMGADKADELIEHIWREKLNTRESIAELVKRMLK